MRDIIGLTYIDYFYCPEINKKIYLLGEVHEKMSILKEYKLLNNDILDINKFLLFSQLFEIIINDNIDKNIHIFVESAGFKHSIIDLSKLPLDTWSTPIYTLDVNTLFRRYLIGIYKNYLKDILNNDSNKSYKDIIINFQNKDIITDSYNNNYIPDSSFLSNVNFHLIDYRSNRFLESDDMLKLQRMNVDNYKDRLNWFFKGNWSNTSHAFTNDAKETIMELDNDGNYTTIFYKMLNKLKNIDFYYELLENYINMSHKDMGAIFMDCVFILKFLYYISKTNRIETETVDAESDVIIVFAGDHHTYDYSYIIKDYFNKTNIKYEHIKYKHIENSQLCPVTNIIKNVDLSTFLTNNYDEKINYTNTLFIKDMTISCDLFTYDISKFDEDLLVLLNINELKKEDKCNYYYNFDNTIGDRYLIYNSIKNIESWNGTNDNIQPYEIFKKNVIKIMIEQYDKKILSESRSPFHIYHKYLYDTDILNNFLNEIEIYINDEKLIKKIKNFKLSRIVEELSSYYENSIPFELSTIEDILIYLDRFYNKNINGGNSDLSMNALELIEFKVLTKNINPIDIIKSLNPNYIPKYSNPEYINFNTLKSNLIEVTAYGGAIFNYSTLLCILILCIIYYFFIKEQDKYPCYIRSYYPYDQSSSYTESYL